MVSILIEFHKFWAYENREAMVVDSTNTEEEINEKTKTSLKSDEFTNYATFKNL